MFTDWIKEYTPFFSNIGTFLKILKYVPGLAGKISSSMSDFEEDNDLNINEVYEKLEEGGINIGSNIYTSGYLLPYGQVFMPYTYTNGLFSPASQKEVDDFNKKHKGTIHELPKGEILFQKKEFIIPTKKLNPHNNIGCAFLYDENIATTMIYAEVSKANVKNDHRRCIVQEWDDHSYFIFPSGLSGEWR